MNKQQQQQEQEPKIATIVAAEMFFSARAPQSRVSTAPGRSHTDRCTSAAMNSAYERAARIKRGVHAAVKANVSVKCSSRRNSRLSTLDGPSLSKTVSLPDPGRRLSVDGRGTTNCLEHCDPTACSEVENYAVREAQCER